MRMVVDTNLLLRFADVDDPAYSAVYSAYQQCHLYQYTLHIVPQNYYEF